MSISTLGRYMILFGGTLGCFYGFCEYQAQQAKKEY